MHVKVRVATQRRDHMTEPLVISLSTILNETTPGNGNSVNDK